MFKIDDVAFRIIAKELDEPIQELRDSGNSIYRCMPRNEIVKILKAEVQRIGDESYKNVVKTVQGMIPDYKNGKVYDVDELSDIIIAEITTYGNIPMEHRTKMLGITEERVIEYQKHYKENEDTIVVDAVMKALVDAFENLKKTSILN